MRATEIRTPERVLMTADTAGGVWTYAMELAAGLSDAGVSISLATMGPAISRSQLAEARAIRGLELYESGFRLEWRGAPREKVTLARARALRPDRSRGRPFRLRTGAWRHTEPARAMGGRGSFRIP